MTREELEKVREWADERLATGAEPPWAWYQYMKLRETLDAILAGMAVTRPKESSPQSEQRSETHLRLVAEATSRDSAQPHPEVVVVRLPM